jgi:hypothetical protein
MSTDAPGYDEGRDGRRIARQRARVWQAIYSGGWWGLADIAQTTGDPEASVSARLRDFRKPKFGAHTVERRYVRDGLHHYRLRVNRKTGNAAGPVKPPKRKKAPASGLRFTSVVFPPIGDPPVVTTVSSR